MNLYKRIPGAVPWLMAPPSPFPPGSLLRLLLESEDEIKSIVVKNQCKFPRPFIYPNNYMYLNYKGFACTQAGSWYKTNTHNFIFVTKSWPVLEIQEADPNSELKIPLDKSLYIIILANLFQWFAPMDKVESLLSISCQEVKASFPEMFSKWGARWKEKIPKSRFRAAGTKS